MVDWWLIDWLIYWFIDILIGWLIYWLRLIDWLIDSFIHSFTINPGKYTIHLLKYQKLSKIQNDLHEMQTNDVATTNKQTNKKTLKCVTCKKNKLKWDPLIKISFIKRNLTRYFFFTLVPCLLKLVVKVCVLLPDWRLYIE